MLVIPAHAKVNLALEVVRRRDDGWHDIESVLVPLDWHDLVGLRRAQGRPGVRVTGPAAAGVPGAAAGAGKDNLAVRAAAAALEASSLAAAPASVTRGFDVWVHKRIPAAAGLGGGSADAAAALVAASRLLGSASLPRAALPGIAARLGSDVPALLARRPVHVCGRGEHLTSVAAPPLHLVVAFLRPSSTQAAYEAVQRHEWSGGERVRALREVLAAGAAPPAELLGSALEAPALRADAELAGAAERLRRRLPAVTWHMTGSGGAFFSLMPGAAVAAEVAAWLRTAGIVARACRSLPAATAG